MAPCWFLACTRVPCTNSSDVAVKSPFTLIALRQPVNSAHLFHRKWVSVMRQRRGGNTGVDDKEACAKSGISSLRDNDCPVTRGRFGVENEERRRRPAPACRVSCESESPGDRLVHGRFALKSTPDGPTGWSLDSLTFRHLSSVHERLDSELPAAFDAR